MSEWLPFPHLKNQLGPILTERIGDQMRQVQEMMNNPFFRERYDEIISQIPHDKLMELASGEIGIGDINLSGISFENLPKEVSFCAIPLIIITSIILYFVSQNKPFEGFELKSNQILRKQGEEARGKGGD